jgi:hypothetical protein
MSGMSMKSRQNLSDQREYAWNYFQLHAQQRMRSFNFFVVIAAILTAGLAELFKKDFEFRFLGVVLGLCLMVISIVFGKLDERVRFLIKHSEDVLKELEKDLLSDTEYQYREETMLFLTEEKKTYQTRTSPDTHIWNRLLSYSYCFGCVYLSFYTLGLVAVINFLWKCH